MLSTLDLVAMLRDSFPAGAQGGNFESLCYDAVRDAVAYGQSRLRERVAVDLWGDGVTTRFALTGRQVRLLEPDEWPTPVGLNTAGIVAPVAAATYTAGAGGALPVGTYLACHAWETALGVTTPTTPVATTVAASGKITRGAVTPPAGATVADYLSTAAGTGKLLRVASGGTGIALDLAAVPPGTAPAAQIPYTALSTPAPDVDHAQPGVNPDGSLNPLVTTLQMATAPLVGARLFVPYTRIPLIPAADSATIGLDDDFLRLAARAQLCASLTLNSVSGDSTDYAGMAKMYFSQLDALLANTAGRRPPRMRTVGWV